MLETELIRAPESHSRWLMVVLHGLGDSLDGYRWLPEAMGLPWMNYLLVNAPDDYYGGYSWYEYDGIPEPGVRRSERALVEVLEAQEAAGYSAAQTYLFGFSQGCLMTVEVGVHYPRILAGLIGISGYVLDPAALIRAQSAVAKRQRFLITHGTADPLIPLAPVRDQFEQLRRAGLTIEWHEFDKVHTIAGESELRVIRRFVEAGRSTETSVVSPN
jgi:phospholipase/carboxylesterase